MHLITFFKDKGSFFTNGIQVLHHLWKKCVDYKEGHVKKINLIWSHSMEVFWSADELLAKASGINVSTQTYWFYFKIHSI